MDTDSGKPTATNGEVTSCCTKTERTSHSRRLASQETIDMSIFGMKIAEPGTDKDTHRNLTGFVVPMGGSAFGKLCAGRPVL